MSRMIQIDFHPSRGTLRQFGWIALAGFSLLALLAWREWLVFAFGLGAAKPVVVGVCLGLGGLAACFSLVYPPANRPIFVGLSLVAFPIGFALSYLILGALFFLLIAPLGLVFRAFGRDLLGRRYAPAAESYWADARPARPRERYFQQF